MRKGKWARSRSNEKKLQKDLEDGNEERNQTDRSNEKEVAGRWRWSGQGLRHVDGDARNATPSLASPSFAPSYKQ
jgi:hypothetical protein